MFALPRIMPFFSQLFCSFIQMMFFVFPRLFRLFRYFVPDFFVDYA